MDKKSWQLAKRMISEELTSTSRVRRVRQIVLVLAIVCGLGCNYSRIGIPDGLSAIQARDAVVLAFEARGYEAIVETPRMHNGPNYLLQTSRTWCFRSGMWNGIWGFPLYWYRHRVEIFDDYVRIQNQGLGWNLWLGLASMVLPVYTSGGLHEEIERNLLTSAGLRVNDGE